MGRVNPPDAATSTLVRDLVAGHAHLFDNLADGGLAETYTSTAVMGLGTGPVAALGGFAGSQDATRVFFPHHTTDTVLHQVDDRTLRGWSKYFVIRGDGTAGSGEYLDTIVRTDDGWRIAERRVTRGDRPDDDPDGPSTRDFSTTSWLTGIG